MQMPMDSVQTRQNQRAGPAECGPVPTRQLPMLLWVVLLTPGEPGRDKWGHLGRPEETEVTPTLVSGTLKYVSEHPPVSSLVTRMCNQEKED